MRLMTSSAGHGFGLAVFPMLAAVISGVFAFRLGARFIQKRRPHEGVWVVALVMYAVASFAMFMGVVNGWTGGEFRVYWLFGAVLNVPYLFAGELYLLSKKRALGHAFLVALVAISIGAAVAVLGADTNRAELGNALPLGKDVFGDGSTPYRLAQYFALPAYFLLLGGLMWSAWQMRGRPELRNRTSGTVWIAIGATIVAVGSGIGAAFHVVPLFSASLAAGIAVMFWGFLVAARPSAVLAATNP
jgi:hypothetical protein